MGIDKVAALVHKTLAEINAEAMIGLHGRSQHIDLQVVKSGQTIEKLQERINESNEKLQKLQVQAEKTEKHNELLQRALKEQTDEFEAYKRDVDRRHNPTS